MASSSIQRVSSSRMKWKYDVFVSFRGEDTRNNFTDHLFGALHRNGIYAFRDDTNLKKGEHISSKLEQAVEGSQILIVLFSRNYASSTWCLRELANIVDCKKVQGHTVLPIFYDVSPSEVRKQSGDFEKAFREHEERFKENLEEVQRWRGALAQVANLSGREIRDKPQNAEIENIIKDVTCLLSQKSSTLARDMVGMHSRMEEVEKLLRLNSDDDVRVVGICGMGGIGKTTLANAMCARISNQFDACCIIDDVRKTYGDHGPIGVQKELLYQTLNEDNLQIRNHFMASNLIQTRLCQIKSLVVLDNVDKVEQLDKLAMTRECVGTGSRIIVISRDSHILREYGVDEVYEVPSLDHNNALQLFCRRAFKSDDIMIGYKDLIDDVLAYADGLPLAIKVLGSFLYGRGAFEWKSALERLRENPRTEIMDVLRISFDGLEDTEKDIFLDIACFFCKKSETYVKKVLDIRGFHPEIGLSILFDKSLITYEMGRICMHDLVQELGKSIVREKSPKEPRKWSRLWDYKDFHNVMSENMANKNIEAIFLDLYQKNYGKDEIEKMTTLSAEALAQMSRLKLLKLWNLNFSGSLDFLSSELGYLSWKKYPFTCLPSSFEPNKLVELILPHSNIRQLWKGRKPLHNLTHIDLSHSRNLTVLPSFLDIPNLEVLNLEGCKKLVQIDPSIGTLRKLSRLNLNNCTNLVSIPYNIFYLSSLKHLNLSGCPKLLNNQLLEGQRRTSFINKVLKPQFGFSNFRKQEDSVGLSLPLLSRVSCLQYLDLSFCNLIQIPDAIGWLHCLESLYLGGNFFVTLPSSIKELSKLRTLNLEHCKQLKYLPELPSKVVLLERSSFRMYHHHGLYIFDCPSLIDTESCYRMAFSWTTQLLKAHIKTDIGIVGSTDIVVPRTEIPKWCNKQNVGSSISMDPLPNMDDKNLIGVAYCLTFVVHDDPTSLGERWQPGIAIGSETWSSFIPIYLGKDLITVDLDHLSLTFYTRERLNLFFSMDEGLKSFVAKVYQPHGLHIKVKNCGYRWIFKDDLEQLNPQMMYSENSSVQNMYLTNV